MCKVWIDGRGDDDDGPGERDAGGGGEIRRGDDGSNHRMHPRIVPALASLALFITFCTRLTYLLLYCFNLHASVRRGVALIYFFYWYCYCYCCCRCVCFFTKKEFRSGPERVSRPLKLLNFSPRDEQIATNSRVRNTGSASNLFSFQSVRQRAAVNHF